jgi:predicted nucleic acid-binding protein
MTLPAVAYLDSSALVKLAVSEPESESLRAELERWERYASSALARTEVVRAAAQRGHHARRTAAWLVRTLELVSVTDEILDAATAVEPVALGSLDAIHLVSALSLGDALGAVVTYDRRLADAARGAGLAVLSPA